MTPDNAAPKCLLCGHDIRLSSSHFRTANYLCENIDCGMPSLPRSVYEALAAKLGRQDEIDGYIKAETHCAITDEIKANFSALLEEIDSNLSAFDDDAVCDHSVGVCWCDYKAMRGKIKRTLKRQGIPPNRNSEHKWDADGERCLKCGDKDWFAGPICAAPTEDSANEG